MLETAGYLDPVLADFISSSLAEAEAENLREHPNGTLSWDPVTDFRALRPEEQGLVPAKAAEEAPMQIKSRMEGMTIHLDPVIHIEMPEQKAHIINVPEQPAPVVNVEARAEAPVIDVWINNAGFGKPVPFHDGDNALWDEMFAVNFWGTVHGTRAALGALRRPGGAIINIASIAGLRPQPGGLLYSFTKAGLLMMTRSWAQEFGPFNIRVNAIAPGYFRTAMTDSFYADPAWTAAMLAKIPLARFSRLEDLMGAAVYLSSPAASYVTGQVLYVDGGTLAAL